MRAFTLGSARGAATGCRHQHRGAQIFGAGGLEAARYAEAHYKLALALHQEGKEEESRIEFERASEISRTRLPLTRYSPRTLMSVMVMLGATLVWRASGLGSPAGDPRRRFLRRQPTCILNRDPNHVPEHFGTLLFTR